MEYAMSGLYYKPLEVLYQDEDLIAVHKPSGLLTHRTDWARGESISAVQVVRDQLGAWVWPVHRLDRPTSGVLVFARSQEVAGLVGQTFAQHRCVKTYLAVVRGRPRDAGEIDKPLHDAPDRPAKEAQTSYRTLARADAPWPVRPHPSSRYALVELTPKTGRLHQLRKHMRSISHPIIGDTVMGDGAHNKAYAEHVGVRRLMLHAWKISLPHPRTGETVAIEAPLPAELVQAFAMFAGQSAVTPLLTEPAVATHS